MKDEVIHTILIAGDNHSLLEKLSDVLQRSGYRSIVARGSGEAFEALRGEMPDLIVCGDFSGGDDDLRARLSADERFSAIPVLVANLGEMEGPAGDVDKRFDEHSELPFDELRLVAKVSRMIGRRQMQEAVQRSEERFRTLIENASDLVTTFAKDGTILFESPSAEAILGYGPSELVGTCAFDLVHPDDLAGTARYFRTLFESGEAALPFAYRCRHKNGTWRYIESTARVLNGAARSREVVVANSRDVTDSKQAEEQRAELRAQLERQNQRLNEIIATVPGVVWEMYRRDGCDIPENEFISDFIEQILGYTVEEWLSMPLAWFETTHPEDREKVKQAVTQAFSDGQNYSFDVRRIARDGRIVWLESRGTVIKDGQGKPIGLRGVTIDITERKRSETEKAHLIARTNNIITKVPGVVWEAYENPDSATQRIEFVSEHVETMLGYSVEDWLSTPQFWLKIVHPDDRDRALRNAVEHYVKGTDFTQEFRWIASDGRVVWVEAQAAAIKDEAGKPIGMRGVNIDITERKRSEEAARASELRFQSLCESAPLGVFLTDAEGRALFSNSYLRKICGFTLEEALGMGFADFFHPEDRDAVVRDWLAAAAEGRELQRQLRFLHRDGTVRWGNARTAPMFGPDGSVTSHVGTVEDITDQKIAETALTEANERAIREYEQLVKRIALLAEALGKARDLTTIYKGLYDFAAASTPATRMFVGLDDIKTGARRTVYGCAEGSELDASDLPPMDDARGEVSEPARSGPANEPGVRGGPAHSTLVTPMHVMGRTLGAVVLQSSGSAEFDESHTAAIEMAANLAANAIDNVRLLELEREKDEQLRQAQRIESVGKLAGGIAHDFNNLLTVIRGYAEITLNALQNGSPLRRNLEEIIKAANRSASLTQQLLAFSRQQILRPQMLDLNEVIRDTAKMLERLIGEDIKLVTVLESDLVGVEADPGQLTQVIMNLAVNARDAMPEGGSLVIQTANVILDDEHAAARTPAAPGTYVMLSIADTGTGIEKSMHGKIFEPFFTTKEVGKGTGLGLSTVYGIVKQSGGYVWVESDVGSGAKFTIYLPAADGGGAAKRGTEKTAGLPAGKESILLVEDEESVRTLSRTILRSCGYNVIEARNGKEAILLASEIDYKFDLLLTDVVMPEMGGKEMLEHLSAVMPGVRAIFMSGYTDDAIFRRGLIREEMNFIQKPFTADALARKVRETLDAAKG